MSSKRVNYLLIGGGLASSAAIQAIRQIDGENPILLVGQEVNRPYHRPQLSSQYLLGQRTRSELFTLEDRWLIEHHVQLRSGVRAAQLDPGRHAVTLDDGTEVFFDKLLIATGGSPRQLTIPGAQLPGVLYLRTLDDADRIRNAMDQARREGRPNGRGGRGRVAVIGAGLLGTELAATFTNAGLSVELIYVAAHPWAKFAGETMGRFIARYLESRGVRLHAGTSALRLEGDGRVQRVLLADATVLDVDLVVPCIGMTSHKELLRATAIACEKAILADERCRTSHPDIYTAGDCAAIYDPLFAKYRILDHWESAVGTGAIAGQNMAGGDARYDAVNTFGSQLFDVTLRAWGEPRHVERRIVRGPASADFPDFLEFGVAADGRLAQVLALNQPDNANLELMIRQRTNVTGREALFRDPAISLSELL